MLLEKETTIEFISKKPLDDFGGVLSSPPSWLRPWGSALYPGLGGVPSSPVFPSGRCLPPALLTPILKLCSQGPLPGTLRNSRPAAAAERPLMESLDGVCAAALTAGEATRPTPRVSRHGDPFHIQRRPQARSACPPILYQQSPTTRLLSPGPDHGSPCL